MQLNSGLPFWPVRNGLVHSYPRLSEPPQDCDALVVGAGITGALIAHELQRQGMKVCVIDKREASWGSTSASTALLQYEIDTEMQDLAKRYGIADAALAYRSCAAAIGKLGTLARAIGLTDFQRMDSLYYASRWYQRRQLEREARLRIAHGLPLKLLDRAQLQATFGIDAAVGLLTHVAAQTDPYRFAHKLLARIESRGGAVHGRTALMRFQTVRGGVRIETDLGVEIKAQHLVFAAGYESQPWIDQRVARNRSSYAFVSEPLPGALGVLKRTLMWESARPYLYIRRTSDERLLVGGEDDGLDIAVKRDLKVDAKAAKLLAKTRALFPKIPLRSAFAWAGTFAETEDGLPFFGPHEQHGPRVHFAMAYGGNGITYSQIGAELLGQRLLGKPHPCAALFSFKRLARG